MLTKALLRLIVDGYGIPPGLSAVVKTYSEPGVQVPRCNGRQ
jgi:hypothetical protein